MSEEASDEIALRQSSVVIADTVNFGKLIMKFFESTIEKKLPVKGSGATFLGSNEMGGDVREGGEEEESPKGWPRACFDTLTLGLGKC